MEDRRQFITGIAAMSTVGIAGCADSVEDSPIDMNGGKDDNEVEPSVSGDISRVEWANNRTWLEVYFEAEHNAEAVWFTHSADSTILYITDAPRFEGPIELPVLDAIACDDADYPSLTFEVTAAEGRPIPGFTPDTTGEAEISLPEGYIDRLSESEYYEGDEAEAYCMAIEEGHHPDS